MHRSFVKQTIALLVLLVYCFTAQTAFAEPAADLSAEPEATLLYELEELRTENSKTFLLSDGSFQYVGYADTVHYSAPNGELREIHSQIADCTRVQGTPLSKRLWNLPKLAPQKTLPHRFTAIPMQKMPGMSISKTI